ncbi:hypothetical protein GOBAR_DD00432 [Gossypium barbadense]|nr:hypothetical protein GOBAR_DD00432 [Gossypium barbadense]
MSVPGISQISQHCSFTLSSSAVYPVVLVPGGVLSSCYPSHLVLGCADTRYGVSPALDLTRLTRPGVLLHTSIPDSGTLQCRYGSQYKTPARVCPRRAAYATWGVVEDVSSGGGEFLVLVGCNFRDYSRRMSHDGFMESCLRTVPQEGLLTDFPRKGLYRGCS